MTVNDVLLKLEALKTKHATASQTEAVAKSHYDQAQAKVKKAEDELRALGVDPEKSEAALAEELKALDAECDRLSKTIDERMVEYKAINEQFQKIGAL